MRSMVFLSLAALLGAGCERGRSPDPSSEVSPPARRSHLAPDFTLKDVDGNTVKLSELRGKVVLITFWSLR